MNSFFIMITYWTGSGRSRPKSWRTCFSVCGSALRPAMRAAGSTPGVAKKIRNTSTLSANMTNSVATTRRMMNAITSGSILSRARGSSASRTAVAEDVQAEHGGDDCEARRDRDPGPCVEQALAVVDDRAPARVRRLHADREERERRLGQHVERDHEREEDDHRRDDVRQDLGEDQARVRRAHADRGLDELLLADRQHLPADRPRDVRHVDDADDRDRDPETPGVQCQRVRGGCRPRARRSRRRSQRGRPERPR